MDIPSIKNASRHVHVAMYTTRYDAHLLNLFFSVKFRTSKQPKNRTEFFVGVTYRGTDEWTDRHRIFYGCVNTSSKSDCG